MVDRVCDRSLFPDLILIIEILLRGLYFVLAFSIILKILRSIRFPQEKMLQTVLAICIALAGAVALPFLFLLIIFAIFSLPVIVFGVQYLRYRLRFVPAKSKPKSARSLGKTKTPDQKDTQMYSVPLSPQVLPVTLPSGEIRCGNCGVINNPSANFCRHCGNPLKA
jgi:hypothetical protein